MTGSPPSPLLLKTAWEHPATAAGHRRVARRRWIRLVVLLGLPVWPMWSTVAAGRPDMLRDLVLCVAIFAPHTALTWAGLVSAARARRILMRHPWRAYARSCGAAGERRSDRFVLELGDGDSVVVVPTMPTTDDIDAHGPDTPGVWLAGDPRTGGVVSPVGGHHPVRVVRSRARERDPAVRSPEVRAGGAREGEAGAVHPR